MRDLFERVAKTLSVPIWWVESIAVEYLDCRDYGSGENGIWEFNFSKITEENLLQTVKEKKIVISQNIIIHNVRNEVLRTRMLESIVSNVTPFISENEGDCIVEGKASLYYYPCAFNDISIVDPKQNLSNYFQVYDDGQLWQWKFCDLVNVEDRHYEKHVSNIVKLDEFDQLHFLYDTISSKRTTHEENDFVKEIKYYFETIQNLRNSLLADLLEYHYIQKEKSGNLNKVTKKDPPILSRFESFTVKDNTFYTKCLAAPIFYKACYENSKKSHEILGSVRAPVEYVTKLDTIYQYRATAIITGASCIESFINQLGYECFPDIWDNVENLSIDIKYQLFLKLKNKTEFYDIGRQPYNQLNMLIKARNRLVHFKPYYEKVKNDNDHVITTLNYFLNDEISQLPEKIRDIIEFTCKTAEVRVPAWLYNAPGWEYN